MYYKIEQSETVLSYKGVNIYAVYKDDDINLGAREYLFGTDADVSDGLDDGDPLGPFDIRDTVEKSIPMGKRTLREKYVYDEDLSVMDNLKRLIDLGGIDFNDGEFVEYDPSGRKTIPFGEWDEVQSAPGEKIQVEPFVVTKIDSEAGYVYGFRSRDGHPVQGGLNYVGTGRRIEDVIGAILKKNPEESDAEKNGKIRNITAVERDGLDIRTITVSFRVPDAGFDLMEAIKKAVAEFAETENGKDALEYTCGYFNLADVAAFLPEYFCRRHGFTVADALNQDEEIDWDFDFTDYVKDGKNNG